MIWRVSLGESGPCLTSARSAASLAKSHFWPSHDSGQVTLLAKSHLEVDP